MNKLLQQFCYSSIKMLTLVDCMFTVDSSGDAENVQGNLIESVEHDDDGHYIIHLVEPLNALQGISLAATGPDGTPSGVRVEMSQDSDVADPDDPQITVQCFNGSGVATDPATGCGISVLAFCRNSSVSK